MSANITLKIGNLFHLYRDCNNPGFINLDLEYAESYPYKDGSLSLIITEEIAIGLGLIMKDQCSPLTKTPAHVEGS